MFEIRSEQIQMLSDLWSEHQVAELAHVIRTQYPDRVPKTDQELVASAKGWIEDAVQWGFVSHEHIKHYVEFRARFDGQRQPLSSRLCGYLTMYHQELISGIDLSVFANHAITFAEANGVKADEGVAWLAVILLAAKRKADHNLSWIRSLLATPGMAEEARLHLVHVGAQNRGWIRREASL